MLRKNYEKGERPEGIVMGILAACMGLPLLLGSLVFGLFMLYTQFFDFSWLAFGMAIMFVGGSTGLLWFGIPTVLDACFPIRWEVCRSDSEWRFQKKLGRFVVRRHCARGVTFRAYPTCSRGDHGYALYGQSDRRQWRLLGCVFTATAASATRQAEADLAALRQYVSAVA